MDGIADAPADGDFARNQLKLLGGIVATFDSQLGHGAFSRERHVGRS